MMPHTLSQHRSGGRNYESIATVSYKETIALVLHKQSVPADSTVHNLRLLCGFGIFI
jgi:hypothetical protein